MTNEELISGLNSIRETLDGFEAEDNDYYMKVLDEAINKIEEKKVVVDLSKVDWKMLRKQKIILDNLSYGRLEKEEVGALVGMVNLLDNIQDQAAEQIGEEKVFGTGRKIIKLVIIGQEKDGY